MWMAERLRSGPCLMHDVILWRMSCDVAEGEVSEWQQRRAGDERERHLNQCHGETRTVRTHDPAGSTSASAWCFVTVKAIRHTKPSANAAKPRSVMGRVRTEVSGTLSGTYSGSDAPLEFSVTGVL